MKISPTGRSRYRELKRSFRSSVLVLQLEFRKQGTVYFNEPCGVDSKEYDDTYWKDADIKDLTLLDGGILNER